MRKFVETSPSLRTCNRFIRVLLAGWCLLVLLAAVPGWAQEEASGETPTVIYLDVAGETADSSGLYQAIRAQLSAAQLTLRRVDANSEHSSRDFDAIAEGLINSGQGAHGDVSMVFWIEDADLCRLHFYINVPRGERTSSRVLNLTHNSSWSRNQTIAIAAASMIEGLLTTLRSQKQALPSKSAVEQPVVISPPQKSGTAKTWAEFSAAYAGVLIANELHTSGVRLGIGLFPGEHLVVGVAFTPGIPAQLKADEYRLTVTSRTIECFAAGRMQLQSVEFRAGVAWQIDLRSVSAMFYSEQIDVTPNGMKVVNVLMPYLSVVWEFNERVGLFGQAGAGIGLNDTEYVIRRSGGSTKALAPYWVRFSYMLGMNIWI